MSILYGTGPFIRACLVAASPLVLANAATAQSETGPSLEEVQTVVAEAMAAIAAYSEAQREAAAAEARIALRQLDAAIAARHLEMREAWAEMTEPARAHANTRLAELQTALVDLAERVGTLQGAADSAWVELNGGLLAAWDTLSMAMEAALEPPSATD